MRQSPISELDALRVMALSPTPLTARDVVDRLSLPRATVYRLLARLECTGWLESEGNPKRFYPSLRLIEMGLADLRRYPAREELFAGAVQLARDTGRTAVMAVYDRGDALFTENVALFGERIITRPQGRRFPAMSNAPGKAMLAQMPPDEIDRVISAGQPKLASHTLTTPAELRAEIETTQRRGYGFAFSEAQEGSAGVAMAVFDRSGRVVGALSVGAHVPLPAGYPESVLPALHAAVAQVSSALGYRPHMIEALA